MPDSLAEAILGQLVSLLGPLGRIKQHKRDVSKAGRRAKKAGAGAADTAVPEPEPMELSVPALKPVIGINAVTRTLSKLVPKALSDPEPSNSSTAAPGATVKPSYALFLCSRDAQPPHLHSHFPLLCARTSTKLIPLPLGSEAKVAGTLGVARAVAVLLKTEDLGALKPLIEQINEVQVPWLPKNGKQGYVPLKIRTVETTAPVIDKKKAQKQAQKAGGEQKGQPLDKGKEQQALQKGQQGQEGQKGQPKGQKGQQAGQTGEKKQGGGSAKSEQKAT